MLLRWLVGLAAVAVIAFVGYFFWSEYDQNRRCEDAQELFAQADTSNLLGQLEAIRAQQTIAEDC